MDLSCFHLDDRLGYVVNLDLAAWPNERVLRMLHEIGYRSASWSMPASEVNTPDRRWLEDLRRQSDGCGMAISEINVEMDMVTNETARRRAGIAFLQDCLRAASDAQIRAVKSYTGPIPWNPHALNIPGDISEGEAWTSVERILEAVLPVAEETGVQLWLEAVFGHLCHDYYTMQEILRRTPSPNLGVVMDPSHLYLYGNDIPWAIRRLGDRVRHVHLKDIVGRLGPFPESFVFPLLGEGQIEWTPFFQALKDIGYQGHFTIEFESFTYYRRIMRSDPERAAKVSFEHFRVLREAIEQDDEYDGAARLTPWMRAGG